jgi:predicted ATP-dependent serine protease
VVLDHISFLASYHDQDERKALDQMSNQLAQLAVSQNFCLIEVAHLNREGKVHGSSNLEKTCFVHLDMYRDSDNDDPDIKNLVTLRVRLNRRYGDTGKVYLRYSADPFQLSEVPEEEAKKILGLAANDD